MDINHAEVALNPILLQGFGIAFGCQDGKRVEQGKRGPPRKYGNAILLNLPALVISKEAVLLKLVGTNSLGHEGGKLIELAPPGIIAGQ